MKNPSGNHGQVFGKTTQLPWMSLFALFVLVPPPVVGQPIDGHQRKVDIRAHWGSTYVSAEDSPTECACGDPLTTEAFGGAVSTAVGARLRLGVEALHGRWPHYDGSEDKLSQTQVGFLVEHEFWSYERLNPYLVLGVGYNHFRWSGPIFDPSLPNYHQKRPGSLYLGGGLGTRFFLTRNFFVAAEFRIGLRPVGRFMVSGGYAF